MSTGIDPFLHGKDKFDNDLVMAKPEGGRPFAPGVAVQTKPEGGRKFDAVNHPKHYTSHPSGVEVIQITEHMNFCLGNAVKYLLRAELKDNKAQDLNKAIWYIRRELEKDD